MAAVHYIRLAVSGMKGRASVREVTARLRDVPGVSTVLVDRATCVVALTGVMTEAAVLAALDGSDHQAVVLPELTDTCS